MVSCFQFLFNTTNAFNLLGLAWVFTCSYRYLITLSQFSPIPKSFSVVEELQDSNVCGGLEVCDEEAMDDQRIGERHQRKIPRLSAISVDLGPQWGYPTWLDWLDGRFHGKNANLFRWMTWG